MTRAILLAMVAALAASGQTVWQTWTPPQTPTTWPPPSTIWPGTVRGSGVTGSGVVYPDGWNYFQMLQPTPGSELEIAVTFQHMGLGAAELVEYLRATADASLSTNEGTFYAATLKQDTLGAPWVATIYRRSGGVTTQLATATTICTGQSATLRAVIRNNGRIVLRWNSQGCEGGMQATDTTLTTGDAGFGVIGQGLSSTVIYYYADTAAPGPVLSGTLVVSRLPEQVDMVWQAAVDNSGGAGIRGYHIFRNGQEIATTPWLWYTGVSLEAQTNYTFGIQAEDWHGNLSTVTNVYVAALSSSAPADPRRVGVRPTGAYWGGLGEQIDTRSMNLNYSMPLIKAVGRNGLGATVGLSYNSQLSWQSGYGLFPASRDTGYGFGWSLMAGSVVPVYSEQDVLAYYLFTDATGAQYKLDVQAGDTWTGTEGMYVWYNAASNQLYFKNGTFWKMDCVSGDQNLDAGTRYPTMFQDANGNQIAIRYAPAVGSTIENTSSRIKEIEDVRAVAQSQGPNRTYVFTYDNDQTLPHLTSIQNMIGTSEAYTFTYTAASDIINPFTGLPSGTSAKKLATVTVATNLATHNLTYTFTHNTYAELTKLQLPYGGELEWEYVEESFANNKKTRVVANRILRKTSTDRVDYGFTHPDHTASKVMYAKTALADPSTVGFRKWTFSEATDWTRGLQTKLEVHAGQTDATAMLMKTEYTWTQNLKLHPYIGTVVTTSDPGSSNEKASKSEQVLDHFGNMNIQRQYDYGSLTTPVRTTTCSYNGYLGTYVLNMATGCSEYHSDGGTKTLFSAAYDQTSLLTDQLPTTLFDNTLPGNERGNQTQLVTPLKTLTRQFRKFGGVATMTDGYRQVAVSHDSGRDYAVPSTITPNNDTDLSTTMSWDGRLGLTQQTSGNTFSVSAGYDADGFRTTSVGRDGGITYYVYSSGSPAWKMAYQNNYSSGRGATKTYFDGLGRPVKMESYAGAYPNSLTLQSTTETEYGPCACSPIGKVKRVSMPYAPGGNKYWTVYTYDALGRTVSVKKPKDPGDSTTSAGTTTYAYAGNMVTVTDPRGRWKTFTSDAAGNLVNVKEQNPQGGNALETNYAYNRNNKLTTVMMTRGAVTQTRTFQYDELTRSRLMSQTFPESGTTTFTYNAEGKLATKTNAKNETITYSYNDDQGRMTQVTGPMGTITYAYDYAPITGSPGHYAAGLLAGVTYPGGSEYYEYSWQGRMTKKRIGFTGLSREFEVGATWNEWGQMTSTTYPKTAPYGSTTFNENSLESFQVVNNFDSMGRPSNSAVSYTIPGQSQQNVQFGAATYDYAGRVTSLTHVGSNIEWRGYNTLGQLTRIAMPGSIDVEYVYSDTQNDGKIVSQKDWASGEEVVYQYDSLSRLTQAETTGSGGWGQAFEYDGFGNLTAKVVTKGSAPAMSVVADGATNRLVGTNISYDAAGQMTLMPYGTGQQTMTYDALGRMTGVANADGTQSYTYDTVNRRTSRIAGGQQEHFVYGIQGELIGIYAVKTYAGNVVAGEVREQFFYFSSTRLARRLGGVNKYTLHLPFKCVITMGMDTDAQLDRYFAGMWPHLDEHARRLVAASKAVELGYGGISRVSRACGLSRVTLTKGVEELQAVPLAPGRIRHEGGGRHSLTSNDPGLAPTLDGMVEPTARGDPQSPLRWTCKSARTLAAELTARRHPVSHTKVTQLLREGGYSLQGNRKTEEGDDHPDRDAQFRHINRAVKQALRMGEPVISVDTKKKELIGNYRNQGRQWRKRGTAEKVKGHDFPGPEVPRAYPYGIYDLGRNAGFVNVGTDHDTGAFAVASIRGWWQAEGRRLYPSARRLLITADGGGSNGWRLRLWKWELQRLADRTGLTLTVCHFPPGTSKWNKVEHRLFSFISSNWRGEPLRDYETVVRLIAGTTTAKGLKVTCRLDHRKYPVGRKITDEDFAHVNLRPASFHGEWNYAIHPSNEL